MALTRLAHQLVRRHLAECARGLADKVAVDATCGNGHDTEFLARLGFKHVFGFDVQETAISNTRRRLNTAELNNVSLIHQGHQHMRQHLKKDENVECVMFNFGYLPNADKQLTTCRDSSLEALRVALEKLSPTGIICLICYPGHPEGAIETSAIQAWLDTLKAPHQVTEHLSHSPKPEAPILYIISHH